MDKFNLIIDHCGSCGIRNKFHLYCPCCGGTRALKSLLELHIIKSLQYNPIVVFALLFVALHLMLLLIERLYYYKHRFVKLRLKILYVFFGLWMLFSLVRNFMLFYMKVDLLGNIL